MWHNVWLLAVGIIVGAIGTLVGAGGGFLLVPYLILVERLRTQMAVSISMAVVFWNALSGSIEYLRQKRTDVRSGLLFTTSALPGALIGTAVSPLLDGELFRIIFSFLLLLVTYRLLGGKMFPDRKKIEFNASSLLSAPIPAAMAAGAESIPIEVESDGMSIVRNQSLDETVVLTDPVFTRSVNANQPLSQRKGAVRSITDLYGHSYQYAFRPAMGVVLSFFVGVYSGLFGVGGGILHVPIMVGVLDFPIHIATATSHFVLTFTSLASSVENLLLGSFYARYVIYLSIGVVAGAQLGARLANRVSERGIKIVLGVLLLITSAKMILN